MGGEYQNNMTHPSQEQSLLRDGSNVRALSPRTGIQFGDRTQVHRGPGIEAEVRNNDSSHWKPQRLLRI